ncbi:FkbM family methyltransferase [Geoglobus acetivorans]|uniref:FkbM family methyltransferase n=1 Tax=Geoglobus acetivorans TaxID=565033 RepID=A0ABZ3H5A7_GEOAI|nr:FkbM family methyltransferase [Geoglobus acetivorans]
MIKNLLKKSGIIVLKSLDAMEHLFIPNKLVEFIIDKGQKFFTVPTFSAQGYYLFLTKKYGAGSELEFQKIFASIIKEGYIVVDVGAHFGFYTLIAAERVGDSGIVLAFEPSSFNYEILTLNINSNNYKNIETFNFALGDTNTIAKLALPKGSKSGENTMGIAENAEIVENVQVKRFDSIFYEDKLLTRAPDIIKIDVEGAEVLVLRGFGDILHNVKYILCEIHPNQMKLLDTDTRELFEIFQSKGFGIYIIQDNKKLAKLVTHKAIEKRCHIVAINTHIFNEKEELQKISDALQQPYTLGAKKLTSFIATYYIAKLIYLIQKTLVSSYRRLF